MNKKILLVSIIAVVILVLVSFTGVVGYQTTKSSTVARASPLFNVRSNRAIGEESKILTCKYVGKGITLPFPERDDRTVLVQKVVDRISKMDDKTFEKFIAYIINYARKDNRFNGVKSDKIREALNLLRYSDKSIPIYDADINHNLQTSHLSMCCQPIATFNLGIKGFLFCILLLPIAVGLAILFAIYLILVGPIPTLFIYPIFYR